MASDTRVPSRRSASRRGYAHAGDHEQGDFAPGPSAIDQQALLRRGSSRSLARLLKTLHEFALILDSNGIIQNLWSSNRWHLRPIENALLGRRLQDLANDQMVGWIARMMQDATASGQRIYELQPVALADGEHSFSVSVVPMAAKPGGPKTTCLLARDLTPWKASREASIVRESLLAQAEELANVGSWEVDFENRTLNWSAHFYRMMGLPPERGPVMLGRGIEMIHPDDRERGTRDSEALRKDGKPFDNELRFLTAHRGVRIFHSRAIALRDGNGRIVRIRGMSQDVTERREAEEKLREREALLAQAEQIANFASWQYEFATQKVTFSPNMRKILGLGPDTEWTSDLYWSRIHPEDRARARAIREQCTAEGKAFEYEARFLPPEGGMRFLHVRGAAILDAAAKPLRRTGVVQDITERREAEEKFREREALLAHAEEIANLGSFQLDLATRKAILSPNLRKIFGLCSGEEWNSEACWERVHPQDRDRARESMARGTESAKPFEFVMRFTPPGGAMRHLQVRGSPQADSTGKVTRLIGVVQDITEQREIEESLRERQALLTHAEHIANFGSWQLDLATEQVTLSPHLMEYYGFTAVDNWTRDLLWSRIHPEERASAEQAMNQAMEERRSFDFVARCLPPGGSVRFVRFRGEPLLDAEGKPVRRVGVAQDITEQREAEEKLREREALLTQAEQIANFGSWQNDFRAEKTTLSPNLRKILGFASDDEWSFDAYRARLHPKDRDRVHAIVVAATEERKSFEYVTRYVLPEGGVRILHLRGVPILDSAGQMVRRVGVAQDITDQVRAEEDLRRLSQQLMRARDDDRRHIARELHESAGQSLAALKMTLGRLRDVLDENTDSARALLRSAVELADVAVREVRTVSYLMHPPMLDEAGLGPALRWYARGFAERSGIQVQVDVPAEMPRQSQELETTIFRIVQEALTNVHRYSGSPKALIRIACQNGDICAEVRDEGCGLPPPRRSWGSAEALGVGIAGMRERVKQLNGAFELESAPGTGTTVRVTLPTGAKPAENFLGSREESLESGNARPNGA